MSNHMPTVVTTEWLADNLNQPDLKIIASESMTVAATASSQAAEDRDVCAEFEAAHIPGAGLFNLDEISDPDTALLMMLPSQDQFSAQNGALGISNDDLLSSMTARAFVHLRARGGCSEFSVMTMWLS